MTEPSNQDVAIISAVVLTLRGVAEWVSDPRDAETLRKAADDVDNADLAELACCPFCSEVICDDDCPLYGTRRRLIAWP